MLIVHMSGLSRDPTLGTHRASFIRFLQERTYIPMGVRAMLCTAASGYLSSMKGGRGCGGGKIE